MRAEAALANQFEDVVVATSDVAPDVLVNEPFTGVTTDGLVIPELYKLTAKGFPTGPVRDAARAFLSSLNAHQRRKILFPIDSDEWRWWSNARNEHRSGLSFIEMRDDQRQRAFDLMAASLSAYGFETARNVMRLNETLEELSRAAEQRFSQYGEFLYWMTMMGEPSHSEPWGWQIDGHHLAVNYFVLGEQVTMTPVFMGGEPPVARSGKYAGVSIMQEEERSGLAMLRALNADQRARAVLSSQLPREVLAGAFRDNYVLDYAGICYEELTPAQRDQFESLMSRWVGYLPSGHAETRLEEVKRHFTQTYFAWMGNTDDPTGVFYYRIQSPMIVVEFDHLPPLALRHGEPADYTYYAAPGAQPQQGRAPIRDHIHTVVRTPNGNDYGKDLLRQHYARFSHRTTRAD